MVTIAFGISFLIRATFNTIQYIVGYKKMIDFKKNGGDNNIGW